MARVLPDGKYYKDMAPLSVLPDSIKAGFSVLLMTVGKNKGLASQHVLDFRL